MSTWGGEPWPYDGGYTEYPARGLVFEEPKNASSRRLIVLLEQLLAQLQVHKRTQAAEREQCADLWTEHDLVFPNELGGPMDDRNDYRAWVALLRTAKVRRMRLHDGRHTAATSMSKGSTLAS